MEGHSKTGTTLFGTARGAAVMFCSGCGSVLTPARFITIPIEVCGGCGGTWLEEGRLKWILEIGPKSLPAGRVMNATRYSIRSNPSLRLPEEDARRIVKCPYCIGVLRAVNYSANSGVAVYRCLNDHGVWVPKGGIDRLIIFIDTWDKYLKAHGPYYSVLAQMERKRFLRKLTL